MGEELWGNDGELPNSRDCEWPGVEAECAPGTPLADPLTPPAPAP